MFTFACPPMSIHENIYSCLLCQNACLQADKILLHILVWTSYQVRHQLRSLADAPTAAMLWLAGCCCSTIIMLPLLLLLLGIKFAVVVAILAAGMRPNFLCYVLSFFPLFFWCSRHIALKTTIKAAKEMNKTKKKKHEAVQISRTEIRSASSSGNQQQKSKSKQHKVQGKSCERRKYMHMKK